MWADTETNIDYINFSTVADSVVELIEQAEGKPLSIGVSGAWGVGKSSLVMLTREALERRERARALAEGVAEGEFESKYIFVSFNAWLYQGYDDARAALMEAIAVELAKVAEERKTGVEKTQDFLRRIDWFRFASLTAGSAAALALGLPPVGLIGQFASLFNRGRKDGVDDALIEDTQGAITEGAKGVRGLLKDKPTQDESPRQRIQALRDSFVAALQELDVTLVVLIDDLDRCLPETAISTLEAIRLFLFLDGTAFVIAADDQMIKHAVKKHFDQPDDALVTNYFDKLIQIPIRVPTLGTQEVRAYMFLLYVHNSTLGEEEREHVRVAVCERLAKTWQGLRIDRAFIQSLGIDLPTELVAQLDTADRLTPIMATATGIAGNPRLVKRFLNALSVRMAVAKNQGVSVDEAALAKLLLFERLAPPELYQELATSITNSVDGKPHLLDGWEPADSDPAPNTENGSTDPADPGAQADAGAAPAPGAGDKGAKSDKGVAADDRAAEPTAAPIPDRWAAGFAKEWLELPPRLADIDMRGALYVSREHLPILTVEDGLSSTAAELLKALIEHPSEAGVLTDRLGELSGAEQTRILDRLLDIARPIDTWGVPEILEAMLVMVHVAPSLSGSLAGFLGGRPAAQIQPDLIPRISGQPWATDLMTAWTASPGIEAPVKAAIANRVGNGHLAK